MATGDVGGHGGSSVIAAAVSPRQTSGLIVSPSTVHSLYSS